MLNRRQISLALGMATAVVLTAGALIASTISYSPEKMEGYETSSISIVTVVAAPASADRSD